MSVDADAENPLVPAAPGDLVFQRRLEESQWWSAAALAAYQWRRLGPLVEHARRTVPFYRERLAAAGLASGQPIDGEAWSRLAPLTRQDLQRHGAALRSAAVPPEHGALVGASTSGSTGTPVTVLGTMRDALLFKGLMLRFALWHKHDFAGKLCAIRRVPQGMADYPHGAHDERWADEATFPFATGPLAMLSIATSIEKQAEWLARQDPDYLLTYPSNLRFLARHCREQGLKLPRLKQIVTMAEVVHDEVRAECRQAWNAPIVDAYSAQEVGNIAFQCPAAEHYHVQAETMLVEIVDRAGRPCPPGETGRVLVTPLLNHAMPLLRYALGDWAELGGPCACGRGLPVLTRILGRERNSILVGPTGERYWPAFGSRRLAALAPIVQHQFAQVRSDTIEARLVTARPLTPDEETAIRASILAELPAPFRITLRYLAKIPRNAGGKYENFVSELPG
jgi:phenylacetate-CoA ligase